METAHVYVLSVRYVRRLLAQPLLRVPSREERATGGCSSHLSARSSRVAREETMLLCSSSCERSFVKPARSSEKSRLLVPVRSIWQRSRYVAVR